MEALTRLVSESLARHGFDRPLDYRRLQWSRWFRCESHHSLLFVPSKPGVFALAEEVMDLRETEAAHVAMGASPVPRSEASAKPAAENQIEAGCQKPDAGSRGLESRRMLAVAHFFEDDDMAFVLDRMLSRQNAMRGRLMSGRYFIRFVVIEDPFQRRSICSALNQWIVNSAEKVTGIGSHFASSLELTPQMEHTPALSDPQTSLFADSSLETAGVPVQVATAASFVPRREPSGPLEDRPFIVQPTPTGPQLNSGASTNIHHPSPFPSGF